MARPIPPGPISRETAERLGKFVDTVRENKQRLEARRLPARDRFPAKITSADWSYTPPRYAWTEQTYDSMGARIDKPGGRTGTATYSPAFTFGDGTHISEFPHPCTLIRRLVATDPDTDDDMGPVYETAVYCGCVAGTGSGGDQGDGYILVPCCPNPIKRRLTATWVVTAGTCAFLDGQTITLNYDTVAGNWFGSETYCTATEVSLTMLCSYPAPGMNAAIAVDNSGTCVIGGTLTGSGATCSPFSLTIAGITVDTCPGATLSLVITE